MRHTNRAAWWESPYPVPMSLSGSWSRWRFGWRASRSVAPPRVPGHARALTVRGVARDFALWEAECVATSAPGQPTMTTVIGNQVVEVPLGQRPIEEVACHLRRLRVAIDLMSPDVSYVRWEGVIRAYDDYLFAACHELGVPTDLVTIGFGRQRDEERERLERVLQQAGLAIR